MTAYRSRSSFCIDHAPLALSGPWIKIVLLCFACFLYCISYTISAIWSWIHARTCLIVRMLFLLPQEPVSGAS